MPCGLVRDGLGCRRGPARAQAAPAAVQVERCLISPVDEAEVPAQEAGVLKEVNMKEGQQVSSGQLLAQIDDAKPRMAVEVAKAKLAAAKEKAGDDINVRYAEASRDVAEANYQVNAQANRKVRDSVPAEVLRELLMKYTEAKLSIEKSKLEMRVAARDTDVAKADLDAAEEDVRRHQVCAPQNGMVDKVHRHAGEWVQMGDPVMHVIRLDRLRVDGFVSSAEHRPGDLHDCDAQVSVVLAGSRKPRTFPGKVVFVDPNIQAGGNFLVRVEVQNEKENDFWLLSPGMMATMKILPK